MPVVCCAGGRALHEEASVRTRERAWRGSFVSLRGREHRRQAILTIKSTSDLLVLYGNILTVQIILYEALKTPHGMKYHQRSVKRYWLTAVCWSCDGGQSVCRRAGEGSAAREPCSERGEREMGHGEGDEMCGILERGWVGGARGCGLSR